MLAEVSQVSLRHSQAVWTLELSSTEKLIALCVADHANDDGVAWPSVSRIAERCGLSQRCATKTLGELVGRGVLAVTEEERGTRSRRYRVIATPERHSPRLAATPERRSPLTPEQDSGVNRVRGESRSATPERRSATPERRSPESLRTEKNGQIEAKAEVLHLDGFGDFYAAYPRREKRAAAERAWRKLKPSRAVRDKISARVKHALDTGEWQINRRRFIPLPASFLNEKRWEDDVTSSASVSSTYEYAGYGSKELWECGVCGEFHDRPLAEVHPAEARA